MNATSKKKVTKSRITKQPARPAPFFGKWGQWLQNLVLIRPALVALMVALAWLGQEQLWGRHLGAGLWLWVAAAVVGLLTFYRNPMLAPSPRPEGNQRLLEAGALSLAIILGFVVRVYNVTVLPHGYFFDEATNALIGLQMLVNHSYLPIFGPPDAPAPTLYHYLNALMQYFGGAHISATKMVPVLLGTLTIPMVYFLMRRIVAWPVALASTFLLVFMRWHINFSRINFIGIATPLFAAAAAYFLLRGLETKNRWAMALSGLAVAMGLYTYYASNLVPLVLGPYMALQLFWEKDFLKTHWRNLLVFLGVSLLVFAPLGYYALTHLHEFTARNGQVLLFNHLGGQPALNVLWTNVKSTLLMFNYFGDTNGRHNIPEMPMLDMVSGVLLGLGVIWALAHLRRKHAFLALFWWLVALVPGFITIEAPQGYRCIGAIIPVVMLMGLGLNFLWSALQDLSRGTKVQAWTSWGLILLLGWVGVANTQAYFTQQATQRACWSEFSAREYGMGQLIKTLGSDYHTYISAASFNYPTIRYLGYPDMEAEPFMMTRAIPSNYAGDKNLAYLLLPIHDGALPLLRYYYPGGKEEVHHSPYDFDLFTSYLVSHEEVQKTRGLLARYQDRTGKVIHQQAGREWLNFDIKELGLQLPVTAQWQGSIIIPHWGSYSWQIMGLDQAMLRIDHQPVGQGGVILAQGQHLLEIKGQITQTQAPVQIRWMPADATTSVVVPGRACLPQTEVHGLKGTYWNKTEPQGKPDYERIDPLMSMLGADFPMAAPFCATWTGKIMIPETGKYAFGLLQNQEAWLSIDREVVVANTKADTMQQDEVFLRKGEHSIRIEFKKRIGAYPRLVFYWTRPGQVQSKVPFTALTPE